MTALSRCKTAIRRPILFLALVCLIGLAGCGNAPTAEKWTMDASWAYGTRTIKTQTETAEIIAVGEVTKVDPARWNSPDGKQWEPKEEGSLAMVYTTFYVQPTRLLKGESKFGTPIPFRVVGGIIGDTGQAANAGADAKFSTIASGQQVIVFGLDDHRFERFIPEGCFLFHEISTEKDDVCFLFCDLPHLFLQFSGCRLRADVKV